MIQSGRFEVEERQLSEIIVGVRALAQSGRIKEARGVLARIIDAKGDHAETLHLSGVLAAMSGEPELAANLIARAVRTDPVNPAFQNDLGVVYKKLRQWDAAMRCYDRAIVLNPVFAEAHNNRGNVLAELHQPSAAIESFRQAIAHRPDYSEAHHNLGVMFRDLHQWSTALASFNEAIALDPHYANAFCNRGVLLERMNRLEAALADYDRAIAIDRGFARVYANRGNVLRELGSVQAAMKSCDQALAITPGDAQAHQNKAVAQLLEGNYTSGWTEFEWRWKNSHSPLIHAARAFTQPLWLGEQPLERKSILLHAEQGLGDTFQFCRYTRMVADRAERVILEVQPPLVAVMKSLDDRIEVIARGESLGTFDYHCPLMSLPLAHRTTLETIPAQIPYLYADPLKAERWRNRLGQKGLPRVGLVWSGGFRADMPEIWALHERRNIPLSLLAPLRDAPVEFYSLQKGQPGESELTELVSQCWDGPPIHDLSVRLQDFTDTAALIDQLDLIISVDTSTAHLAAAMGKPVWLLNRFDTCWRWLLERDDSPWYPSVRLYRQPRLGDWNAVVDAVRNDLLRFLAVEH